MSDVQTMKLTNPLYIGVIAPLIKDYYDKVFSKSAKQGITYETLFSYFVNVVQNLGNVAEVWVSIEDNVPVAFASWNVLGFPYFGCVYGATIYNNSKDSSITKDLVGKFIEFAKEKRAPYIIFETQSEASVRIFRKVCKEFGVAIEPTNITQWIGRV